MNRKEVPPLPFASLRIVLGPLIFSAENWRWNTPIPDCFNLWVALEGRGKMETLGNVYPIQPGTAFIFSPHQKLSGGTVVQQRFRNFMCRFLPAGGGEEELKQSAGKLMGVSASDLARTKELCRAAIQSTHYNDDLSVQQTAGLCYQILAQVWRDAHSPVRRDPDSAILRLMDRLRERPSQRLSLEEMAKETRLSVAQFSRRFLALSGESPMRFAIRQRMVRAEHLLQVSPLQISEIAHELGYADIYFFSRQFKQSTGMSPSAYRRFQSMEDSALSDAARDGASG